ncbi:hypothetical protein GCM10018954_080460 [Kutzneria kofuensis]
MPVPSVSAVTRRQPEVSCNPLAQFSATVAASTAGDANMICSSPSGPFAVLENRVAIGPSAVAATSSATSTFVSDRDDALITTRGGRPSIVSPITSPTRPPASRATSWMVPEYSTITPAPTSRNSRSRRRHSAPSRPLSASPRPTMPGDMPSVVSAAIDDVHGSPVSAASCTSGIASSTPATWQASSTSMLRPAPSRRSAGTPITSSSTVVAR